MAFLAVILLALLSGCAPLAAGWSAYGPETIKVRHTVPLPVVAAPGVMPRSAEQRALEIPPGSY